MTLHLNKTDKPSVDVFIELRDLESWSETLWEGCVYLYVERMNLAYRLSWKCMHIFVMVLDFMKPILLIGLVAWWSWSVKHLFFESG